MASLIGVPKKCEYCTYTYSKETPSRIRSMLLASEEVVRWLCGIGYCRIVGAYDDDDVMNTWDSL